MLSTIVTVGPFLAGISALAALTLTLTKSAFLRRREESLRNIRDSLDDQTRHKIAVAQLHRKIVAALVARQAHGMWRFMWPWLVWLVTTAVLGQTGFYLGKYLETGRPFSFDTFAADVFGGDTASLFFVPAGLLILANVFVTYEHSLFERARTTRDFFNTGVVAVRASTLDGYLRERRPMRRTVWFARAMTPGLCAVALGLAIGVQIYIHGASDAGLDSIPLMRLAFWTSVTAAFSGIATGLIAADVREYRMDIETVPRPRVPREVRIFRARIDRGLEMRRANQGQRRNPRRDESPKPPRS
ncbi:hypothetical protein IU436_30865 [Nocardia farcinica]|uniref:hypothetical protein n=1 Tax=Nocardia farcinica TaxID=37329 RepID=UPI001894749A|nr:hypothetical protein [Nocardia farcinica]MBF6423004.1 hypothetical protein [Nocardia farcinica]MBF6434709.1 hypothetical protein [Nocardia farcinica]MBF6505816.1 hypothetical protein [Nocardia farcinica]